MPRFLVAQSFLPGIQFLSYISSTNADKISQQSRAATGVKLQKLDEGDHLAEVVLVPHEQIEDENIGQVNTNDK